MHVHYSNRLINILRITKTHILNRYRQEWSKAAAAGSDHHPLTHDLVQLYLYNVPLPGCTRRCGTRVCTHSCIDCIRIRQYWVLIESPRLPDPVVARSDRNCHNFAKKWSPGPTTTNRLERRVSRFSTICSNNQPPNSIIGEVTAIFVSRFSVSQRNGSAQWRTRRANSINR